MVVEGGMEATSGSGVGLYREVGSLSMNRCRDRERRQVISKGVLAAIRKAKLRTIIDALRGLTEEGPNYRITTGFSKGSRIRLASGAMNEQ
jgi:hypothetical protein